MQSSFCVSIRSTKLDKCEIRDIHGGRYTKDGAFRRDDQGVCTDDYAQRKLHTCKRVEGCATRETFYRKESLCSPKAAAEFTAANTAEADSLTAAVNTSRDA